MGRDAEKLARLITFLPYNLVEDVVVHGRTLEPSIRWEEGCLLSAELGLVPPRLDRREQAAAEDQLTRAGADLALALRRILEQCVFPRGGYLLKFSASGVLVMFTRRVPGVGPMPWSAADEDVASPEKRAARCGVELLGVLREALPNAFTIRAGLETGRFRLALCGQAGRRLEQLALGSLCGTVARLRNAAGPGELVVGPRMVDALTGWQPHVGPLRGEGRRLVNVPPGLAGENARVADLSSLYRQRPRQLFDRLSVLVPDLVVQRAEQEEAQLASAEIRPVTMAVIPLDVDHPDDLDDSAVMLDLDAGVSTLLGTVEEHGGVVLRLDTLAGGSAAVAAFGLADTPRRASRGAVAACLQLSHGLGQERSRWVVRAAVETGRALVGELGSPLKRELAAVGGPAVVARELATHAMRGQVLVGETAWRMCGSAVQGRDLGQFSVGQPPQPWPVHVATGIRAPSNTTNAGPSREGSADDIPGDSQRMRLRARLARTLQEAQRTGRGSAVVLYGAEGSGKTELVAALADQAAEMGFRGGSVRCPRDLEMQPPSALAVLLSDLAGIPRDAGPDERRARVLEQLAPVLAGAPVPLAAWPMFAASAPADAPPPSPALLPASAVTVVTDWLRRMATQTPLWLALEDVHHLDDQALAALSLLMKAAPTMPVVMVVTATHDPDQGGPVMAPWIISALHRTGARWYGLPPLNMPEAMDLLARELGVPDVTAIGIDTGALLGGLERTGGQPRGLRDMAQLVRMRQAQSRSAAEAWQEASEALSSRELWQLKLDALPADTRTLVRLAAVMGLELDAVGLWRTLQAGGGTGSVGELVTRLGKLVEAGVLAPALVGGQVGYRFRSAMLRDVAYESWPPPMRARWHGHAAAALLSIPWTHGAGGPGRTAHHLRLSAQPSRALPHLVASAAHLASLGHLREAAEQLDVALPLARRAPEERRRAELVLARTCLALGEAQRADRVAAGLAEDAAATADARAEAWSLRAQAALLSDDDAAAALAAQAGRRSLARSENMALRVGLAALQVEAAWRRGEPAQALLLHEQVTAAVGSANQPVDPAAAPVGSALRSALVHLQVALAGAERALERTADAVRRLESLGTRIEDLRTDRAWALLHARLGDMLLQTSPPTATWSLSAAVDALDGIHQPHDALETRLHLVRALLRSRDVEGAANVLDALWVRAHLLTGARAALLAVLDTQHRALGDPRGARSALDRIRGDIQPAPPRWRPLLWLEMARTADLTGDGKRAEAWRQEARQAAISARAPALAAAVDQDITLPR